MLKRHIDVYIDTKTFSNEQTTGTINVYGMGNYWYITFIQSYKFKGFVNLF